jgi:hypothetical protein
MHVTRHRGPPGPIGFEQAKGHVASIMLGSTTTHQEACQRCYSSHQRCSGIGPCSNCARRSTECLPKKPRAAPYKTRGRAVASATFELPSSLSPEESPSSLPAGCETPQCQGAALLTCDPCMHHLCQLCSLRALASVDVRCACCRMKLRGVHHD